MRIVTPEEFKATWTAIATMHRLDEAVVINWAWNNADPKKRRGHGGIPPAGMITNDDLTRRAQRALFDLAGALRLGLTWECPAPGPGKLDAVLFEEGNGPRNAVIAYEHSGTIDNTVEQEVRNLCGASTPLRVLVTYPWPRKLDDRFSSLQAYAKRYTAEPRPILPDTHFLVIFGMPDGSWEFYKYQKDEPNGFVKLT